MSGYFGKKPGFRVQPLTLSQIRAANDAAASTISGLKTFSTTPKFSALTSGSIPFIGAGGQVSEDNTGLFYDNTNDRLGLGTTSPAAKVDARSAATQIAFGAAVGMGHLGADGTNGTYVSYGAKYDSSFIATQTAASLQAQTTTRFRWHLNTGLVSGNTFTPTMVAQLDATGLGVGATPACKVDAAGTIRATNWAAPASGAGTEVAYLSNEGYLLAIDRSGPTYKPLRIVGNAIYLSHTPGNANLKVESAKVTVDLPFILKSYTLATLPTASSYTAGQIYVTDLTGGAEPCFSDGTNWRKYSDRSVAA